MTNLLLKNSDICLSLRFIDQHRTIERALALMGELHPTRIEWSYVTDRELIARFRELAPVFVATLNTIFPAGHAESFTGELIIAPWMTRFGSPGKRMPYICQNNPDDLRTLLELDLTLKDPAEITKQKRIDLPGGDTLRLDNW